MIRFNYSNDSDAPIRGDIDGAGKGYQGEIDAVFATTDATTISVLELEDFATAPAWAGATGYGVGDIVIPPNGISYRCTVGGTSGGVAPTHTGGEATDGTVTWQRITDYTGAGPLMIRLQADLIAALDDGNAGYERSFDSVFIVDWAEALQTLRNAGTAAATYGAAVGCDFTVDTTTRKLRLRWTGRAGENWRGAVRLRYIVRRLGLA